MVVKMKLIMEEMEMSKHELSLEKKLVLQGLDMENIFDYRWKKIKYLLIKFLMKHY